MSENHFSNHCHSTRVSMSVIQENSHHTSWLYCLWDSEGSMKPSGSN
jgi:hypothetical protein